MLSTLTCRRTSTNTFIVSVEQVVPAWQVRRRHNWMCRYSFSVVFRSSHLVLQRKEPKHCHWAVGHSQWSPSRSARLARRFSARDEKRQLLQTILWWWWWSTVTAQSFRFFLPSIADVCCRPGGFGARDYRNPAQLRNNRGGGGGNRAGGSAGGFNNHQQQWDGSNGGNVWGGDHQSGGGGSNYERFPQQQPAGGGNGSRQQDPSWWDNTA